MLRPSRRGFPELTGYRWLLIFWRNEFIGDGNPDFWRVEDGAIVGRGAHLFIVDDPIKSREEAESERAQSRLREWFVSVAYTRMMPGRSGIVVIMTRWHYYDLVGYLLKVPAN